MMEKFNEVNETSVSDVAKNEINELSPLDVDPEVDDNTEDLSETEQQDISDDADEFDMDDIAAVDTDDLGLDGVDIEDIDTPIEPRDIGIIDKAKIKVVEKVVEGGEYLIDKGAEMGKEALRDWGNDIKNNL